MSDYLVKSLVYDGAIRAYAVDATETVGEHKNYTILGVLLQLLLVEV